MAPESQESTDDVELESAVLCVVYHVPQEPRPCVGRFGEAGREAVKETLPRCEVYRTTVVRVHKAEVPELVSLIHVGNAGGREVDDGSREGVPQSGLADPGRKSRDITQKPRCLGSEQRVDEFDEGVLELCIGLYPTRVDLIEA